MRDLKALILQDPDSVRALILSDRQLQIVRYIKKLNRPVNAYIISDHFDILMTSAREHLDRLANVGWLEFTGVDYRLVPLEPLKPGSQDEAALFEKWLRDEPAYSVLAARKPETKSAMWKAWQTRARL